MYIFRKIMRKNTCARFGLFFTNLRTTSQCRRPYRWGGWTWLWIVLFVFLGPYQLLSFTGQRVANLMLYFACVCSPSCSSLFIRILKRSVRRQNNKILSFKEKGSVLEATNVTNCFVQSDDDADYVIHTTSQCFFSFSVSSFFGGEGGALLNLFRKFLATK